MTQFTPKEMLLLENIAHSEMCAANGATPESAADTNSYLWADERASALGISEQAVGGLLTTLQAKAAIGVTRPTRQDPDGGVWFTDGGFTAWMAQRGEGE